MTDIEANPHLEKPPQRFGTPPKDAASAVILVHGRGQTPEIMFDLVVGRFPENLLAWLAPSAKNDSWYPERFIAPVHANEPWLGRALGCLATLSDDLANAGVPYESQILMGFSQGACLCCEYVWRSSRRYRALVAFTGGLIGPDGMRRDSPSRQLAGLPVLLSSWTHDPWVPVERVRESAECFRAAGANVQLNLVEAGEHGILDSEIAAAHALLSGTDYDR